MATSKPSDEVITAPCTRCGKRRRLRLAHTEPNGAEWWFCRGCRAEFDRETPAETQDVAAEPVDYTFGLDPSDLRPDDPDGVLYEMVCSAAWPAFIEWALKNDEICERFAAETGLKVDRKRSPLEAMIDKVTGYGAHVADRFVEWATVEIYGIEGAPVAYRAEIAKRRAAGGAP